LNRILLVASSYAPNVGGLETAVGQLAHGAVARGHTVRVVTARYPRTLASRESVDGIPVTRLVFMYPRWQDVRRGRLDLFLGGLWYFPFTLFQLGWIVLSWKPDVVNLHFCGAPSFFVLVGHWLLNFRLVVSLHGDDVEGWDRRTPFEHWVFRQLARRAAVVTACSGYLLTRAQLLESAITGKGRVIYNAVDTPHLPAPTAPAQGITAAGRFVLKKGFDTLVAALARRADLPRLLLIGGGSESTRLQALAKELGVQARIEFCGILPHEATLRAFANSSIIVIPSRQEPFGIVAIEAMALGKPVVATRVGGLPEILDGADAVLVAPDAPDALAEALGQVTQRLGCEPEFGARNRGLAARFGLGPMLDTYERVWNES
jgi:glycosyltransferase involved in cell wall biosynthesis